MKLLLDEHIWPGVGALVRKLLPSAEIETIHEYSGGRLMNCDDGAILQETYQAGLTLVTFDVNTIPTLLREMAVAQENHAGVVFISSRSFAQNDHRGLASALVELLRAESSAPWTNRVMFLSKRQPERSAGVRN